MHGLLGLLLLAVFVETVQHMYRYGDPAAAAAAAAVTQPASPYPRTHKDSLRRLLRLQAGRITSKRRPLPVNDERWMHQLKVVCICIINTIRLANARQQSAAISLFRRRFAPTHCRCRYFLASVYAIMINDPFLSHLHTR